MKVIAIWFAFAALPLSAQWLNYRESGTPRTKDGKPDLAAPAPRINGKPDLSGVWESARTPVSEIISALGPEIAKVQVDLNEVTKHAINILWDVKPADQPLRPEARAVMKQRDGKLDPTSRCLPAGVPQAIFIFDFKMIQAPKAIVVLYENGDPARQIHTDGRPLPRDPSPSWMGYSTGTWQGDTLVVQTTGFSEESWLDAFGHPRSETMHIREAYHRRDFGHMDLEMTFDDPKYYTKPFSVKTELTLIPDSDILEYVCTENEKDRAHVAAK